MVKQILLAFTLMFGWASAQTNLPLIPYPKNITTTSGSFKLDNTTPIVSSSKTFETEFLKKQLENQFGISVPLKSKLSANAKAIRLVIDKKAKPEQYRLVSDAKGITISGATTKEIFYGIQTLLQLIPVESRSVANVPLVNITDEPTFSWRGLHLDTGRHFFDIDFIKKYIDFIAMYKMNTFHWHLTEDQGWRLEIKKYPKLTEVGAWRNKSMIGHYNENRYEEKRYGGFYTQEQAKEIVKYAAERHITVVPEIEMPGHASAAIAAYPQLGCTGKQIEVAGKWGVFEDIFCPSEETFTFLENVLTEVMAIFPSKIIHIGGDEAPKTQWETNPVAQAVIKREGLKNEHELQSYFIQRIEKFLNAHGREIIGWDEILEGGLAPNAKVMSWRGFEGGIEAAKLHHDVVMTPGEFAYFDHYQGNPKNEPIGFGGLTTVEKVYSFNPIPKALAEDEKKYIIGAQANLWTEYITTTDHVEYMVFPRITAMSEVLWGTNKDYAAFQDRLFQHMKVLDKKKINYSRAIFEIKTTTGISDKKDAATLTLTSMNKGGEIRYTTDGSEPTAHSNLYTSPISIGKSSTVKAAYFEKGAKKSATVVQDFNITKVLGKNIKLTHQPSEKYFQKGAATLIDGVKGDPGKYGQDWLGFNGKDLEAVIDLGSKQSFSSFKTSSIHGPENWIYYPSSVEVSISDDGKNFKSIKTISAKQIADQKGLIAADLGRQNARYIKVLVKNHGIIEKGNAGAGNGAWLFVDEFLID